MQYSYRKYHDRDQPALEELLKSTFTSFSESNFWFWKYRLNPDFDPSLIVVAEKDGKVVGCNHWLVRDLKLSSSVKVRAALGADVAVHQEHRGRGVGTELLRFLRLSGDFKDKEVVISYTFGDPKLSKRLYEPAAGYVAAPNSTTTYKKFFNCRKLREKFQLIDGVISSKKELKTKLKGLELCILFRLKGAPAFTIHIESERVYLDEGEVRNPDVVIEGSLPLSSSILEGQTGVWDLAKAWMTGEIKITKGLLKIFKMRKAFKVFQIASNQN